MTPRSMARKPRAITEVAITTGKARDIMEKASMGRDTTVRARAIMEIAKATTESGIVAMARVIMERVIT